MAQTAVSVAGLGFQSHQFQLQLISKKFSVGVPSLMRRRSLISSATPPLKSLELKVRATTRSRKGNVTDGDEECAATSRTVEDSPQEYGISALPFSDCGPLSAEQWRFGMENLIQGHVGKLALLGIVLLGVGVSVVTNVGVAEAASSHMRDGDVDLRALALGPEGPLLEEFWDNMRRYGLYFLTVVTGGVYSLVKPAIDALRNPVSAVLIIVVITGSLFLVGLTVSAMLGINEFQYDFAL